MRTYIALALCLIGGCSGVPETRYYILASESVSAEAPAPSGQHVLGVGRVEIPDYLRQRGVIVQSSDHQIRAALYHRWGEPLQRGVRRSLGQALSNALPEMRVEMEQRDIRRLDYRLDLEVLSFHFTEDGLALLGGRWTVYDAATGAIIHSTHFDIRETIAESGYSVAIEAQSALLSRLGDAIASDTRTAIADAQATEPDRAASR